MNVLLDLESMDFSQPIAEFADKLTFGGMMLGIGMLAIFAVLCLLWGALVLFKIGFYDLPAKKKATAEAPAAPAPVAPVTVAAIPAANEDEELIAVLAAAIAMAESENLGAKFRVVSFRRK